MKLRHIRMRPVPPRMQLSKLRMELRVELVWVLVAKVSNY
jgi:hypothetical protein